MDGVPGRAFMAYVACGLGACAFVCGSCLLARVRVCVSASVFCGFNMVACTCALCLRAPTLQPEDLAQTLQLEDRVVWEGLRGGRKDPP